MCGIVGLFLKNKALEPRLGELFSTMLDCMSSRGPDSAGFAVYGDTVPEGSLKLTLQHPDEKFAWGQVAKALEGEFHTPRRATRFFRRTPCSRWPRRRASCAAGSSASIPICAS